jgi:tRNA A-37 threonylcarbamoyl transferase component Bud32
VPPPSPNRSEVFQRVLETAPERRSAVLDQLYGADPDARREIEELVAAADRVYSTASLRASIAVDPPVLAPGTQIGMYVVERELDRGGMSIIYLARDMSLHRPAVLKTSRFSRDERFRTRLEQEARLAARLSGHPNIAVIYGLVHEGEDVYIAQELVEGVTLRQKLGSGPMAVEEALAAAVAIAGAMTAAHAAGIIHRDLKPENIMCLPNGTVKVLDFGIAKLDAAALETSLNPGLTLPGEALGTPGYASPEQLLGRQVDRRSDIFSFGIVLYEMLTGRHPFGESARYAAALDDPQPLPSDVAAKVPFQVTEILERSLQRAPDLRYQSAADLERDLRRARAVPTGTAAMDAPRSQAIWWWRFHLFAATAVNALVVLALWHVREWWPQRRLQPGAPDLVMIVGFFIPLALVCLNGVLRFNLAFTIRHHPDRVQPQYQRVDRWLRAVDGSFAGLTALGGLLAAGDHPNWTTLLIACAVCIVTAAFVIEPNTADAAIEAARKSTRARTSG